MSKEPTNKEITDFSQAIFEARGDIIDLVFPKWDEEEVNPEASCTALIAIAEEMMLVHGVSKDSINTTRNRAAALAESIVTERDKEAAKGQKSETCQPESDENDRQNN